MERFGIFEGSDVLQYFFEVLGVVSHTEIDDWVEWTPDIAALIFFFGMEHYFVALTEETIFVQDFIRGRHGHLGLGVF